MTDTAKQASELDTLRQQVAYWKERAENAWKREEDAFPPLLKLHKENIALREEVERLRSALRDTVVNFHLSHKYSPEGITIPPISTCGHPICEAAWKLVREGQKGSE